MSNTTALFVGKHEDESEGVRWFVRQDGTTEDQGELYVSRSALKALVKAPLLAKDLDGDVVINVSPEAATAAGKANLALMADAARFEAVATFVNSQVPVDAIVDAFEAAVSI